MKNKKKWKDKEIPEWVVLLIFASFIGICRWFIKFEILVLGLLIYLIVKSLK